MVDFVLKPPAAEDAVRTRFNPPHTLQIEGGRRLRTAASMAGRTASDGHVLALIDWDGAIQW
jgi:hypothetical protein